MIASHAQPCTAMNRYRLAIAVAASRSNSRVEWRVAGRLGRGQPPRPVAL